MLGRNIISIADLSPIELKQVLDVSTWMKNIDNGLRRIIGIGREDLPDEDYWVYWKLNFKYQYII